MVIKVKFRQADCADVVAIAPLFDLYRQFYKQASDLGACTSFLQQRLAAKQSVIFVAQREDESLLGFTQLYPSFCSVAMASRYVLYDLFVDAAGRRMGVGRGLLAAAQEYANDAGAVSLALETAVDNLAAQSLYEAMKWEREEEYYSYHFECGK